MVFTFDYNELIQAFHEDRTKILKYGKYKDGKIYIKNYMKEYSKNNYHECLVCNSRVYINGIKSHLKTKKHQKNLEHLKDVPDPIYRTVKIN